VDEQSATVESLTAAAVGGDAEAWAQLVQRYAPLVMSVLAGFRVFGADAQDVSQIVWLRLVEHLEDLREPRALPQWLITTTRNECIRFARVRKRTVPYDPLTEGLPQQVDDTDPTEGMLHAERVAAFLEAMDGLSDRDRTMLGLLAQDPPLSYAEIARQMDIPIGTVGPTRLRMLRKLRSSPAVVALLGPQPEADGRGGGHHDVTAVAG
jgi:RNA polymerase sigma factor (sigma-70 family)